MKEKLVHLTDYRYHYRSNQLANNALLCIEAQKGKLSQPLKKSAEEYAKEILGWKGFAPWLMVYTAINGNFKEGWIPDNYFGKVVIPRVQGSYGKISSLKALNNKIFESPVSPELASYINGYWFDKDLKPISSRIVLDLLFERSNQVIVKLDRSYQGRDIYVYTKDRFSVAEIEQKGNCCIQRFIHQHPFYEELGGKSVATLRVTTVIMPDGSTELRAMYLRLGRIKDTHVKSSNHVRVPVDLNLFELSGPGYLPNWETIDDHPDTKIRFFSSELPGAREAVEKSLKLHQKMPMVQTIGWDFAMDVNAKPLLMEWNGYSNDIKFSEATQGPCFVGLFD